MKKYIKSILFLAVLFTFHNHLLAQADVDFSGSLKWGEELKEPNNSYLSEVLGTHSEGFYALRLKTKGGLLSGNQPQKIYIEKYNEDMDLKKAQEIDLRYKKKKRDFEKMIYLNGQFYLLTSFNNVAHKTNYLFVQSVSKKSLRLNKKIKKVAETPARDEYREGKFNFHISKDSSKVLIYSQLPNQKKAQERFSLQVFDNNFEQIWEKNISLPFPDNRFAVTDYRVDNKGNVYLLGILYENTSGFLKRNTTYQYVILAYNENGEQEEQYDVNLRGKFITDLTFRVGKSGKLICSGFYSDKGTYSTKGTYFFHLDPKTREISNRNYKEFEFDFVTEYMSDRKKRKARNAKEGGRRDAELYQYSLNDLILRSDGGAVLIAEQYYVERDDNFNNGFNRPYYGYYNRYNNFNNRVDYYYNYNDIIVVNIKPNGEIQWATRIPKRQETSNDGGYYSSYAMAIVRDKICFVYNENGKNFGAKKNNRRYKFNGSNSILAITEVGTDGSINTYPLGSNKEQGIITRPKVCKQIGKREMVIFGEKGKRFKFGGLEL